MTVLRRPVRPPGLRSVLRLGGAVATASGLHTAITGARSVPGYGMPADARLESELRFFGAFYSAYGLALWRAAADAELDERRVRELAAVLFVAGTARAVGWRRAGRPSPQQLLLLAVELTAPPLLARRRPRRAGTAGAPLQRCSRLLHAERGGA